MISSALTKTFIMNIIILIIHFLLKHILYDRANFSDIQNSKPKPMDHNVPEIQKNEKNETIDNDDTDNNLKKIRALENFINNNGFGDNASYGLNNEKVNLQKKNPLIEGTASIKPKENDVYSFILEGEKGRENSELLKEKKEPTGTFFNQAHVPQGIKNPELVPENVKVKNEGIYVDPNKDMNPYNSSIFKTNVGNKFLFQDVSAINEDNETGLDEVFKQTQIKN